MIEKLLNNENKDKKLSKETYAIYKNDFTKLKILFDKLEQEVEF